MMLTTLQPQVDVAITATLADPDTIADGWAPSLGSGTGAAVPSQARPAQTRSLAVTLLMPGTLAAVLRATAMYDDAEGDDKTARQDSYRNVRSAPEANTDPVFPDQEPGTNGNQTAQSQGSGREHACGQESGRSHCSQ